MELTKVAKKTSLKYVGHDEDVFCFKQNDNVNCGICCLLFMIDFVSTQVECTWEVKNKVSSNVPNLSTIGTTFFSDAWIEDIRKDPEDPNTFAETFLVLYQIYQEETVLLMEQLRLLYLENIGYINNVNNEKEWGEISHNLSRLHFRLKRTIHMLPSKQRSEWATKVQKLNDNVLRKEFQEIKNNDNDSFITNFSYGSLESVNKSLGVCFGLSKDLEIALYMGCILKS